MSENYIFESSLLSLLGDDGATVAVAAADGRTITVSPRLVFNVNDLKANFKSSGFQIDGADGFTFADTLGELAQALAASGALKDGKAKLVTINGEHETLAAYERKKAFDHIDMKGLLEKYLPSADRFSLSCPFNEGFDDEHMFGIYRIAESDAAAALGTLEKWCYGSARSQFLHIPEEERKKLPPFESLYAQIREKCLMHRRRHAERIAECGGHSFFCDEFRSEEYGGRDEIYAVFHAVDFFETCKYAIEKTKELPREREAESILDGCGCRELKDSLISCEVTFCWHCTVSSRLSVVFFFEINDRTAEWLSRRKNDYDFEFLEDLAFYRGDRLLFSSCTHERFHNDLTELKRKTDKYGA